VPESDVVQFDLLVTEAMDEIVTITKKQITNKDDLTLLTIRIMANLVNNLPLLPEDKENLELLLELTNNDLQSAGSVINALVTSVNNIILGLIEGLVSRK
jgi:uncharacterized 2Fe-2S/4Fe-4S cluster protein (DUF4445 family)